MVAFIEMGFHINYDATLPYMQIIKKKKEIILYATKTLSDLSELTSNVTNI